MFNVLVKVLSGWTKGGEGGGKWELGENGAETIRTRGR